ncbi:hypothetical protein ACT453_37810, partial [Bacillus sp. D-CC]
RNKKSFFIHYHHHVFASLCLGTAEGFLRLPFSQTAQRPSFLRPKSKWRYNPNKVKQKRDGDNE